MLGVEFTLVRIPSRRLTAWTPVRSRILLIADEFDICGASHRIRMSCEVCLKTKRTIISERGKGIDGQDPPRLSSQQRARRRALGNFVQAYRMRLDIVAENVVYDVAWGGGLERSRARMRSGDFVPSVQQCRPSYGYSGSAIE